MQPRRIAVLTSGRQDWGILRSLSAALRDSADFELLLILGGMHLAPDFGSPRQYVLAEGFAPAAELAWMPQGTATPVEKQAADALRLTAEALDRLAPDALTLVGDRFETISAAVAATLRAIPIIHLHGGEETHGALDNQLRHAITKLAHLHFTSHPEHAARVVALGEAPASVHVVGAPGLDNLHRPDLLSREALAKSLQMHLDPPLVVVTMHPATLAADPIHECRELIAAMNDVPATYIITLPNADPGSATIRALLKEAAHRPGCVAFEALGEVVYWSLLRAADAMLGNSSSAMIEAPAVNLPAVNVGFRQAGRLRGANVIDAAAERAAIKAALQQALSPEFRAGLDGVPCPFGRGDSAERMMAVLRSWFISNPPIKAPIPV